MVTCPVSHGDLERICLSAKFPARRPRRKISTSPHPIRAPAKYCNCYSSPATLLILHKQRCATLERLLPLKPLYARIL
eukprot:9143995-Pyramimonas_sp.AAC.1